MRGFLTLLMCLCATSIWAAGIPSGFVKVPGATFKAGPPARADRMPKIRVETFEIMDHPVTNREYQAFIKATGYVPPLHWKAGQIPKGKADFPVIFVNREDVLAYCNWLSKQDGGRAYRLPTSYEFEFAAMGARDSLLYPWGDAPPEGHANYDRDINRPFNRWQDYLQPVRSGYKNELGLYDMCGNIWQMVIHNPDPATSRYKYRITSLPLLEGGVMGGSWARSVDYVSIHHTNGISPGIRHPDLGFRLIRESKKGDWAVQTRRLVAVNRGNGEILLSWGVLPGDHPNQAFNVYRAGDRAQAGFRANKAPITKRSNFIDKGLKAEQRYQYYVRPVNPDGVEGPRSEWVGITVGEASPIVSRFEPLYKQGSVVPIFGDLNGDGSVGCVIRLDNGSHEMSQDPGLPIQLEAFTAYGRSLWRKDICYHDHCFGSANNVPFNVWDMDGDGRAEVICRLQAGDDVYLAILDGLTGEVKNKTPWPKMLSDFQKSSTRIHLSVACLDGKTPAIVTQTGLYENERYVAFDNKLNRLWDFQSTAETSGGGGHKIEIADVDGDGRHEIFAGTNCLNADGTLRWSLYRGHPDKICIHDYLPENPGLEVYYVVESNVHAGVYMVDVSTGRVLWKNNREDDPAWNHGHIGWSADFWAESPGIECLSNRQGHSDRNLILYTADGRRVMENFPTRARPVELDGDLTRELLTNNGRVLNNFDGKELVPVPGVTPNPIPNSRLLMTADLVGDFRDELVLRIRNEDGGTSIAVITPDTEVDGLYVMQTAVPEYALWVARNMGGGYPSIYDQQLTPPGSKRSE